MAIRLKRDFGDSGLSAEHWVLSSMHFYREQGVFYGSAQYDLYLDQDAHKAGRQPVRRSSAQVLSHELPDDDAFSTLEAHFDQLAVAPAVEAVLEDEPEEVEVASEAAGAEVVEGGRTQPARPAPRERKVITPAVPGGPLAGGEVVA